MDKHESQVMNPKDLLPPVEGSARERLQALQQQLETAGAVAKLVLQTLRADDQDTIANALKAACDRIDETLDGIDVLSMGLARREIQP